MVPCAALQLFHEVKVRKSYREAYRTHLLLGNLRGGKQLQSEKPQPTKLADLEELD